MRKVAVTLAWAIRILFAKRTMPRLEPPFDLDLGPYGEADFQRHIPSLQEVERRLMEVPADVRGMRWIHLDEVVLFHGARTFDVPYADFIAKVDITHVAQFYRDAVGVTTQVVHRDECGRARHQGVRIIALPQPNYAALLGKDELDVYKLETIDYGQDEQRVWIVTVLSPNGSAVCDDGYVSFSRSADGSQTVVAFLACQNFPVPRVMARLRMDRSTWIKTVLTENAYRRFCNVMMRNIDDCYHGRDFRVGRSAAQFTS